MKDSEIDNRTDDAPFIKLTMAGPARSEWYVDHRRIIFVRGRMDTDTVGGSGICIEENEPASVLMAVETPDEVMALIAAARDKSEV